MTRMLKKILDSRLTKEELVSLYGGFDIIGDIVVIKIPDNLLEKKEIIAQSILSNIKNVKTVLMQKGPIEGDFRIRELETIAGDEKTTTIYKEHGCIFKVDLSKAYFSPRLATERLRIANLIKSGETIMNLFAGVGSFSIIIAKKVKNSIIYNIDINPAAHEMSIENIKLNKLGSQIIPINGDARVIVETLKKKSDRVLMLLPEKASDYLEVALKALKRPKGIIHYYTHTRAMSRNKAIEESIRVIKDRSELKFRLEGNRIVREVGPRVYQVVLDLEVFI